MLSIFLFLGIVYYGGRILIAIVLWAGPRIEKSIPYEDEIWPPDTATRDGDHITTLPPGKM
jgi:hypothetical protein